MRKFLLLMFAVIMPAIGRAETLRGAVKDSSGAAVSNAVILIHWDPAGSAVGLKSNAGIRTDLSIRTKEDGAFTVDLPPGFYDVFAAAPAFTPACRKVRIKPGGAAKITFTVDADPLYTLEMGDRITAASPKR